MPDRSSPRATSPPAASTGLRFYVQIVGTFGGLAVVHSILALPQTPHPLEWSAFAFFALVAGSFTIHVASVEATMSVSDTFFITSALLFGPAPATVALALDSVVMSWRRGHGWTRRAFNTAAPALSMWVAAHVFFFLARVPPLAQAHPPVAALIFPLICLTLIYFALNSGLTAVAIGLEAAQSPVQIWRHHFLWLSLSYLAAASVSFTLILLIQQISLSAVAVILPVVAVFHLTLRASFGRLEDANRHVTQVDRLYLSTVETLAMAIDAKDDVTHSHVRRVQAYAIALARALGVTDVTELKAIEAAALLHDTGKLAVPERILNKPGGLTPAEFEKMKLHVDVGADILSLVDFPFPVVPIVRSHHESWDGSGYPRGISGTDIPIGARILSVVDCFDALTSDRPYRSRMSDEVALDILRERRGRMYDPQVVDTFIAIRKTIEVRTADAPEHRQVLQQIAGSRELPDVQSEHASPIPTPAASDDILAFVSLARVVCGNATLNDVLALASSLVLDVVPGATLAWFVPDAKRDRLVVAEAYGPAAPALTGVSFGIGERLSGWVAANRQMIGNSSAALDLGERASAVNPPLISCLSVPLTVDKTVVAVLTLYSSERDSFTEACGRLVQVVSPHIAQAIHTASQIHAVARDAATPTDKPAASRDLRLVSTR